MSMFYLLQLLMLQEIFFVKKSLVNYKKTYRL